MFYIIIFEKYFRKTHCETQEGERMDKITSVADYIIQRYREVAGEALDEMKLHKLLYFAQREAFAVIGRPAFEGDFEGWRYGPVSCEVRRSLRDGEIFVQTEPVSEEIQYIVNNVILEYGALASWKLSELSHKETSWLKSRVGLASEENGNRKINLEDIQADADKVRRMIISGICTMMSLMMSRQFDIMPRGKCGGQSPRETCCGFPVFLPIQGFYTAV